MLLITILGNISTNKTSLNYILALSIINISMPSSSLKNIALRVTRMELVS